MEAARPAIPLKEWRRGGRPWQQQRPWLGGCGGARTSGEDLVAQAQAVKVVTASTTAASDLAADGGHAR